ncbi:heavy-metal-associated domain-containing protein [Calothrix sp. CCY 0018]|uniref:heavy-metal-associated domain-containing protein n=1 Tax=Calothrix sp. CCY 0018 TaxID=3103864 RepID=UPI0039C5AADE
MTIQLKVPNIACSACINTVTKAIKSVDADATVDADTKTKIVNVQSQQSENKIKEIIAEAGYPAA